jgi:hypothetical protein
VKSKAGKQAVEVRALDNSSVKFIAMQPLDDDALYENAAVHKVPQRPPGVSLGGDAKGEAMDDQVADLHNIKWWADEEML